MENMLDKLKVLSDAAKYDVSCATSGVNRQNTGKIGSAASMGICHSWSSDGRCISLLKVLFTNKCVYDCQYCVNRRTADVQRASFEPEELADLVIEFYRRNYIEGLFLSSAVEVSPDYTTERIIRAIRILRETHGFAGYIHAKIVPGVSPELVNQVGLLADRLSINIELPTTKSLELLAPQKKMAAIVAPMKQITETILDRRQLSGGPYGSGGGYGNGRGYGANYDSANSKGSYGGFINLSDNGLLIRETGEEFPQGLKQQIQSRSGYKEKFAPAGQSTQMIIGATPESDRRIIKTSESLYKTFKMKRVYFSAYIPVGNAASGLLPSAMTAVPLRRENRLYQADWLMRFYKFTADEIIDEANPFLDLEVDPKMSWALRNLKHFPMEINKVSYEELLRIPGVGTTSAMRIIRQRRLSAVKFDDLKKLGVVVKRAQYFLTCCGKYYGGVAQDPSLIRQKLLPTENQLSMFGETMPARIGGGGA